MVFRPPEYAALINPIAVNAFAMRVMGPEVQSFLRMWCSPLHQREKGPRDWSPRTAFCVCEKSLPKCTCRKPAGR